MNNSVGVTGSENVGIGRAVLSALTSGSYNIAIGNGALVSNTTASYNTAVGYTAAYSNTTGSALVAMGPTALYSNTTGNDNTAIGYSAMNYNTTGGQNTALGRNALYNNTTGVATFGTVTGGSGYTNGTYNNVQLTYSSGTTATTYPTANIVVSGGAVTTVTLVSAGTGFKDTTTVLTAPAASIGGTGSGFTVPVSTLAAASNNTAVGYQAGYSNTTGGITAVGDRAAYSNTTGNTNVAVGGTDSPSGWGAALQSNTTGNRNTAVGTASLNANTTGLYNTAVGALALRLATTASSNTAIGHSALGQGTTGSNNTALGDSALISNTTASYNTAVGYRAGYSNTTSQQNTAVGYQALYSVLPATISVSAGALTNGVEYTITGLGTVNWTSIGAASATVGVKFTYNNVTITGSGGSVTQNVNANNVAIGYQAGDVITTGTGNVIIGGGADPSVNSATDQIVIGNGVTGQANTNVTIGNGTGKIYNAYTVNATWTQTSDGTMKNVIGPDSLGLSFINRLNPILFTWKAQNDLPPEHPYYAEENKRDTTRVIHGFVAQEVKAALDAEGCSTFNGWDQGDDGIQAISREMFISPLVKAVQELSAQVEQLKAELAALKGA
jgi:hypothetical protein